MHASLIRMITRKKAEPGKSGPVQLLTIPWGKPDSVLARGVMHNLRETTPPITVPCHPHSRKVVEFMARHGIACQ